MNLVIIIPEQILVVYFYSIALTKLDILDVLDELKIGVAYYKDGVKLNYFPGLYTIYY